MLGLAAGKLCDEGTRIHAHRKSDLNSDLSRDVWMKYAHRLHC